MAQSDELSKLLSPLALRVLGFARERELLHQSQRLVAAVSGGPDSVCLLSVLHELSAVLHLQLHVAHLNHGLRGTEALADAEYVRQLATGWGLLSTIESRAVAQTSGRSWVGMEGAARSVRYQFLSEVAGRIGAQAVALGHQADDQAETILMHLLRGSGLAGLRGMLPQSYWPSSSAKGRILIIRPLLHTSRAEIEAYCATKGLHPRQDASNQFLGYWRNQIRSELMPLIKRHNPQVLASLLRLSHTLAADHAFLSSEVERLWPAVAHTQAGGISLDTAAMRRLPEALRRHLLRHAVERLLGDVSFYDAKHVEAMETFLSVSAGKTLHLPRGLVLETGYGTVQLVKRSEARCHRPALEGEHILSIPGTNHLPGWQVESWLSTKGDVPEDRWMAYLDSAAVGTALWVRHRHPGDRFFPLGLGGEKKLQDFMVDAKIPRRERDSIPIVCSPRGIVWVVGWRIDDRFKVAEKTREVLAIQFSRREPEGGANC